MENDGGCQFLRAETFFNQTRKLTLDITLCACIITSMTQQAHRSNDMTITLTAVCEKLQPAMEAAGFDHVLYGTVFKKENVEVYISEVGATKYSISSQSFDGPEDNHHTKTIRKTSLVTKHLDTSYAELVKALVEEATALVKKH